MYWLPAWCNHQLHHSTKKPTVPSSMQRSTLIVIYVSIYSGHLKLTMDDPFNGVKHVVCPVLWRIPSSIRRRPFIVIYVSIDPGHINLTVDHRQTNQDAVQLLELRPTVLGRVTIGWSEQGPQTDQVISWTFFHDDDPSCSTKYNQVLAIYTWQSKQWGPSDLRVLS